MFFYVFFFAVFFQVLIVTAFQKGLFILYFLNRPYVIQRKSKWICVSIADSKLPHSSFMDEYEDNFPLRCFIILLFMPSIISTKDATYYLSHHVFNISFTYSSTPNNDCRTSILSIEFSWILYLLTKKLPMLPFLFVVDQSGCNTIDTELSFMR